MKRVVMKGWIGWAALGLWGCPSPNTGAVAFELAPAAINGACPAATTALPSEVSCVTVSLCAVRAGGTACDAVPIVRSEDDHGRATNELTFAPSPEGRVRFDAFIDRGAAFELRARYHAGGGQVLAEGVYRGRGFGSAPVRVALLRADQWSCAGAGETAPYAPVPRALHAAHTLPNGDVLIFGGVTGDMIAARGVRGDSSSAAATFQTRVEVYDSKENRFFRVAGAELSRVGFASSVIASTGTSGTFTIRVLGGYGTPVAPLRFDASPTPMANPLGLPFVPNFTESAAAPAAPIDLIYDAAQRTVSAVPVTLASLPDASFNAIAKTGPETSTAVLFGALAFTGTTVRGAFARSVGFLDARGDVGAPATVNLEQGRVGASVTWLAGSSFLVWGGNIDNANLNDARRAAGEIVQPGAVSRPVRGGLVRSCADPAAGAPELPDPVAFHTATAITGGVVVAGGLLVGAIDCPGLGVQTAAPSRPLVVLTTNEDVIAGAVDVFSSSASAYRATILHTATPIRRTSGNVDVVLVGGAVRMSTVEMGDNTNFFALSQAGVVRRTGVGQYEYASLPPLRIERWGHAAALLPDDRLLVLGGFRRTGLGTSATLSAIGAAEILSLSPTPSVGMTDPCTAARRDGGR